MSCSGDEHEYSDEQKEEMNAYCTDLKLLPGFNHTTFPYMLTRTANYVNLLDLRSKCAYQILADKKPQFDNEFMSLIPMSSTGKFSIVFSSASKNDSMDTIHAINISPNFMAGLRHFAAQPTSLEIEN